jgi:hypothetical protein
MENKYAFVKAGGNLQGSLRDFMTNDMIIGLSDSQCIAIGDLLQSLCSGVDDASASSDDDEYPRCFMYVFPLHFLAQHLLVAHLPIICHVPLVRANNTFFTWIIMIIDIIIASIIVTTAFIMHYQDASSIVLWVTSANWCHQP